MPNFSTHKHLFALGLAISLCITSPVRADLPDIGDSSQSFISPVEEQKLGQAFMRSVRQQVTLVDDLETKNYLETLGRRLVSASDKPTGDFSFFLVDEPSINAFAGPGGHIGVHTGLMLAARNESELAGVLAHEIAHVTQRHLYRAYEAAERLSLPTIAATIAAVLLGAATDSSAGIAAVTAIQAGNIQHQLNFTRMHEKEADRVGISTLAKAKIDPFGMPGFFRRLQKSSRLYGDGAPEFLRTHPVTTDRIAETEARAEKTGHIGQHDSVDFQLIQTRLRVLASKTPAVTLKHYYQGYQSDPDSLVRQYGLVIAYEKANERNAAKSLAKQLHRKQPDRMLFRTTLARLYMDSGDDKQGLKLLSESLKLYGHTPYLSVHYANALLVANQPEKAKAVLNRLILEQSSQQPTVYRLLARAASASGHLWEARQSMAEAYFYDGQTNAAVQQLALALKNTGLTHYNRSRIEARLTELKKILASLNE